MRTSHILAGFVLALSATIGVNAQTKSGLDPERFNTVLEDKPVKLFILTNKSGMEVCITNYGARLVSLMAPNAQGKLQDVVTGYDDIARYSRFPGDTHGATVGRFANRIAHGKFTLDGKEYEHPIAFMRPGATERPHQLHSGASGFHQHVWEAQQIDPQTLKLTYVSPDGDGGFPGTLRLTMTYKLSDDNALHLIYDATTDKPTVINMTNHSYFNIEGLGTTVADQRLQVNAASYTATDNTLIPTGEIAPVAGTTLDLRKPTPIGTNRFDSNWVLDAKGDVTKLAARAYSPKSGIVMELYTTEPGVQVYSGMGAVQGAKGGINYPAQGAFCLETQHYPDSPNKPSFPSTVLRPDKPFHSETIYKFLTEK
jgi:aldose 1-epimerase